VSAASSSKDHFVASPKKKLSASTAIADRAARPSLAGLRFLQEFEAGSALYKAPCLARLSQLNSSPDARQGRLRGSVPNPYGRIQTLCPPNRRCHCHESSRLAARLR
jgi:hypothetical protein